VDERRIEVRNLSKRFGAVQAVNDLTFTAEPGRVTGFLGPNGSGKTTALSILLGLVIQDSGTAHIGGKPYRDIEDPAMLIGSSISADFHPAHTGRTHLDIIRRAIGAPKSRVDEMLELTGISDAADRKTGGYSLGMRQRLALGAALMGDPSVIVLDEPINGLDPEGIRWIRLFLKHLAAEGKTVMLSSHLLSEVQQTVDDLIVIRRGELAYAGPLAGIAGDRPDETILIDAGDRLALAAALEHAGAHVTGLRGADALRVTGISARSAGIAALRSGVALTHLTVEKPELESSFLDLIDQGESSGDVHGETEVAS